MHKTENSLRSDAGVDSTVEAILPIADEGGLESMLRREGLQDSVLITWKYFVSLNVEYSALVAYNLKFKKLDTNSIATLQNNPRSL